MVIKIRKLFRDHFRSKANSYSVSAKYLLSSPEGTYHYAWGELALAMANFYSSIAIAFEDKENDR